MWICFFSQTGSEICNIVEKTGIEPDVIISDNFKTFDNRILDISKKCFFLNYKNLSTREEKLKYYNLPILDPNAIITLHGWLNIVPKEICEKYTIYNGHPGLITEYPELKGKDPQKRTWENLNNYPKIGSVIHQVTAGVDEGPVIMSNSVSSENCKSEGDVFATLKQVSLNLWVDFLERKPYTLLYDF